MTHVVGRNDPCPCGSGLKYKQCCAGKARLNLRGRRGWVFAALGIGVIGIVAFGLVRSQSRPVTAAPGGKTAPPSASTPGGVTPQAWAYDSVTKRHYDPGHGHWHDGPPPPLEARGASTAPQTLSGPSPLGGAPTPIGTTPAPGGPTPAPWTYDAQKNQHWDPGHGHWHEGPPPAGAR